ncbi:MAG: hypothetical protein E6K60_05040 [Nitrospirae bacterium]|nr:MAG: hypothetical protein E6K60_05040 [Nitrospirota bacterium]
MKALDLISILLRLLDEESGAQNPAGLSLSVRHRLEDILHRHTAYYFGPADRLGPWVAPEIPVTDPALRSTVMTSVLTTIWDPDPRVRRSKLASTMTELIKGNKRILIVSADNQSLDQALLAAAKNLRGAGLQYRSFLCRYEPPVSAGEGGINLRDLSFDAQMSSFLGKSQSDKAGLRRKLERYLELSPILHYKAEKQKDLDEVRNLEWRLLSALGDTQAKIKSLQDTLAVYDRLPLWHRVGMQVVGSNVPNIKENCVLYEAQKQEYLGELEIVQGRINELKPEAFVEPDMRPEYEDLKDEIQRLGGVERVRDVLATEEHTTRRPFLQAKRVIAVTAAKVASDEIFMPLRFDALLVDEAARVPLPLLLICACMVRERIVLCGDAQELPVPRPTSSGTPFGWPVALSPAAAPAKTSA